VRFAWRLWRALRAARPDVIHGYLEAGNALSLLGKLVGARVVWGVRASNMDLSRYDWAWAVIFRLGAFLSRFADLIIANSSAGKDYYGRLGYAKKRMVVIPNGIDTGRFSPDPAGRACVRAEWGVPAGTPLVGLVGRLDPMKGHEHFLHAAALLARERPGVRFACVGDGPECYKRELEALARRLELGDRLVWAGARADMQAVYSALDVHTSASVYGEGFSNALGEAMACGVPCAATDVGDSAAVLGGLGPVVPPGDDAALADAWAGLLDLAPGARAELSAAVRKRVETEFSLGRLARRTEDALRKLL
jgi:glycosyltransferase involved in cell wall biosynthesis